MIENSKIYDLQPRSGTIKSIVLLLHGLGSNGQDLISLAPYFAKKLPDTLFLSPDAPFPCDMVPEDYPNSFQWFSLQSRDPQDMLKGAQGAAPLLEAFIDQQLKEYNVPASSCALCGFSQGTMMSLYVAPRFRDRLAGVLGYSGALLWDEMAPVNHKMPIHLIHGENDDVVPVEAYHMAKKKLSDEGFTVSGHTTPMLSHSIDEAGIQSGAAFLNTLLK